MQSLEKTLKRYRKKSPKINVYFLHTTLIRWKKSFTYINLNSFESLMIERIPRPDQVWLLHDYVTLYQIPLVLVLNLALKHLCEVYSIVYINYWFVNIQNSPFKTTVDFLYHNSTISYNDKGNLSRGVFQNNNSALKRNNCINLESYQKHFWGAMRVFSTL